MSTGPSLHYLLTETLLSGADRLPLLCGNEPRSCGVVSAEREARTSAGGRRVRTGGGLKAQRLQQAGGEDPLVLDCRGSTTMLCGPGPSLGVAEGLCASPQVQLEEGGGACMVAQGGFCVCSLHFSCEFLGEVLLHFANKDTEAQKQ